MDLGIEVRPGRWIKLSLYKSNPLHPTIFMIHGLGGRGYQFREQIKHLQNRFNLVVPDLLGQGDSEKPQPVQGNLYSFDELRQDLQALFTQYSTHENYIVGHSYGGAFAAWLAKMNQSKVQKLVLITPVSCKPFKQVPLVYILPAPILEWLRPYLDKTLEKLIFHFPADPVLLKEEKTFRYKNAMYVIKALLQGMREIPLLPIKELTTSSLVISGKEDKLIFPHAVSAFYGQLPHHRFYLLEKAAHMVHLEKSREVNQLLDQFLLEVPTV